MQPHFRLEAAETLRCGWTTDVVKDWPEGWDLYPFGKFVRSTTYLPPILNDGVVSVVFVVTVEEVVSVVVVEVVVFVV